jgi:hypothetical protein
MWSELSRVLVWVLAGTFLIAGAAKLLSPSATALAIVRFGLLRSPRTAIARAVGVAELVLATLIVYAADTGIPLVVATMALVVTSVLIGRALLRGEDFPCGCFGASDTPLSRRTLLRNVLFIGLSASLVAVLLVDAAHLTFGPVHDEAIRAVAAASVLCSGFLVATVAPLLRWNIPGGEARRA